MDKNLLYKYGLYVSGAVKEMKHEKDEELCNKEGFYLFWFVYRYILGCETLEEALKYNNRETLVKYGLFPYVREGRYMYVGYADNKVMLKEVDVVTILEILYNKYHFFEQMECFCRNVSKNGGYDCRRKRCEMRMQNLKRKVKEYNEKNY